ncbi:hypothetical protein SAMN06295912_15021 [Sphingomonas laterariae]|uniref:Uncharacterized protein n=1 Tax=Edaphosphingomonas laterariae TaxID=861865 RepID=A0A239KEE5_9SPHN|nr:hypothetical protein [Sphingomonas laterariae]SNT16013.1 hypothetical protein SAMN06295912_15021 [Sphingomonas laterariae]
MGRYPTQTATRVLLESQRDRLRDAIITSPLATVFARNSAERYLKRVNDALGFTDTALSASAGLFGRNGWAPGIDDAITSLRRQHELTALAKVDAAAAKRIAA